MPERKNAEPLSSMHLNNLGCRLGLPVSGAFELTARCNFSCKMCYVHLQNDIPGLRARELTVENWLSIAREARDMGLLFLLLTGGEPMLREDFPYIYEELSKMGFVISINSNASLYNDTLSELFRRYPPSRINVTLYGGSEDTYGRLCGNRSFERVLSNLRRMREDGVQVSLNVTLTPYNVNDMERILENANKLGLNTRASAYMYPPVRTGGSVGENTARFTPEEAGQTIARWESLRDDRETFVNRAKAVLEGIQSWEDNSCAEPEGQGVSCRAGRSSFWITWEGKMMPCGTMDAEGASLRELSFKEAWSKVMQQTGCIRLPAECSVCRDRKNCGVCASICKSETGRFDGKPEYMCAMTRAKIRELLRLSGIGGENEA